MSICIQTVGTSVLTSVNFTESLKDVEVSLKSTVVSPRRNVFTVTRANAAPEAPTSLPSREDMEAQKACVREHRQKLHQAFMEQHEKAQSSVSESDKCIGVRALLHYAAERDMAFARAQPYPEAVVQFMHSTWRAFLQQADGFLRDSETVADGTATFSRSSAAIENISSIGVWFNGPNISIPLRQYAVQVPVDATGGSTVEMQTVIVVGLLSFTYSSYVMQLRALSQQAILTELKQIEEELNTRCLFCPRLLISS